MSSLTLYNVKFAFFAALNMAAAGSSSEVPKKVIVLVLGDVGHSPRICYHASSLASHGVNVELVGYSGSQPHPELLNNNLIRFVLALF